MVDEVKVFCVGVGGCFKAVFIGDGLNLRC